MTGRKTYWHLQALGRKPSDYETVTSKLLYYPEHGFEVETPATAWYERYQKGSPLRARDLERFRDPRETVYTTYTEIQKAKETFVDGLLRTVDETGYDRRLSPEWVETLGRVLPTLRYPVHGLQMVAAYVGHMAPGGRIVITCLLQAADEIRRIQRIAYRMRQLQETHPGFGDQSKTIWHRDPQWQPLRQTVERLLVTYDWGEAFVALNLVLKPMFDALFMSHFARLAERRGDDVLGKMLLSLEEDCAWHRDWSAALVRLTIEDDAGNRRVIQAWIDRWREPAAQALEALAPLFGESGGATLRAVADASASFWRAMGLEE
jgi:toluene monooxygenase system protein E